MKIKKAIGSFEAGGILCELEDGRFAFVNIDAIDEKDRRIRKATISYTDYTFTRGKEIDRNIPEVEIEKAAKILEDPNSNILELDDKDFKKVIDEHRKDKDDVNNRKSHGRMD